MGAALAILWLLGFLSAGLAAGAAVLALRLFPDKGREEVVRSGKPWLIKGLVMPLLIWLLMNIGFGWWLPPFSPQVQAAQNRGLNWLPDFFETLGIGWLVISSFWASGTLAWALARFVPGLSGETLGHFKGLCLTAGLGMLLVALGIFLSVGWAGFGLAVFALLAPIAGYAPGQLFRKAVPPMYARAVAKMKFGKYTEAEWEIIRELEKCEDDFEGWMMMATLYAEHFHNVAEAEQTILEICDQPHVTPSQMGVALNRLADWYLKLKGDPDAARRALQVICHRLPGSHLARMAQLRINQLPLTRDELREQQTPSAIPLPILGDTFDAEPDRPAPPIDKKLAIKNANDCTARLHQDPNNVAVREKFARILAEQLDRVEDAIEQLYLLLGMPDQAEPKRANWLSLIAAWQLKYRRNTVAGRAVLEQIVREFPQTPHSLAARRRLTLLERLDQDAKAAARER